MSYQETPGKGRSVGIISVPIGFGAGKRGAELGPAAIKLTKIRDKSLVEHITDLGYSVTDHGETVVQNPTVFNIPPSNARFIDEMVVSSNNSSQTISELADREDTLVILSGDHSCAIGTFSGMSAYFQGKGQDVGLLWFDAHADVNTPETTESGNIHGMPLATLLGFGDERLTSVGGDFPKLKKEYFAHVGGRDLDPAEKRTVHELGLRENFFTMSDIDQYGMLSCVKKAIEIVSKAPGGFCVTFDVDMIDPRFAPGSGTLVRGGTTYREAHLALELIAAQGKLRSFEIVEVNPTLDKSNITVELAFELILSALGKTIL